jgi:hypothetical protein
VTNKDRIVSIREIARSFSDPFGAFVSLISDSVEVKLLNLHDFTPRREIFASSVYTLVGDASHAMTMCKSQRVRDCLCMSLIASLDRGEGANHGIVDVLELKEKVLSKLGPTNNNLRFAIQEYQQSVVERTFPAVLASRQACLDAHDWTALTPASPLLTRRQMILDYKR